MHLAPGQPGRRGGEQVGDAQDRPEQTEAEDDRGLEGGEVHHGWSARPPGVAPLCASGWARARWLARCAGACAYGLTGRPCLRIARKAQAKSPASPSSGKPRSSVPSGSGRLRQPVAGTPRQRLTAANANAKAPAALLAGKSCASARVLRRREDGRV